MINVGVHGSTGRVGQLIIKNLKGDEEARAATLHAIEKFDIPIDDDVLVTNNTRTLLENSDVVIDFTLPDGTEKLLETVLAGYPTPLVIGTTGLNKHQLNLMEEAAQYMPILYATNMSLGVAIFN